MKIDSMHNDLPLKTLTWPKSALHHTRREASLLLPCHSLLNRSSQERYLSDSKVLCIFPGLLKCSFSPFLFLRKLETPIPCPTGKTAPLGPPSQWSREIWSVQSMLEVPRRDIQGLSFTTRALEELLEEVELCCFSGEWAHHQSLELCFLTSHPELSCLAPLCLSPSGKRYTLLLCLLCVLQHIRKFYNLRTRLFFFTSIANTL